MQCKNVVRSSKKLLHVVKSKLADFMQVKKIF